MYRLRTICLSIWLLVFLFGSTPASAKSNSHARHRDVKRAVAPLMLQYDWPEPDLSISRLPHETSCHHYYLFLSDEDVSLKRCPHAQSFDYHEHKCKPREKAACFSKHFNKHDHTFVCPLRWGKFPDVKNCRTYYQCLDYKWKRKRCARYEKFDKAALKCVAEIDATCAEETDIANPKYRCPKEWGVYPDHEDCSKYYECLSWNPVLRSCERDKLYDHHARDCLSKEHVDCRSRNNPYEKKQSSLPLPESTSTEHSNQMNSMNSTSLHVTEMESVSSSQETVSTEEPRSTLYRKPHPVTDIISTSIQVLNKKEIQDQTPAITEDSVPVTDKISTPIEVLNKKEIQNQSPGITEDSVPVTNTISTPIEVLNKKEIHDQTPAITDDSVPVTDILSTPIEVLNKKEIQDQSPAITEDSVPVNDIISIPFEVLHKKEVQVLTQAITEDSAANQNYTASETTHSNSEEQVKMVSTPMVQ